MNVEWISGYWAWDDTRSDYLWISGVYRNIPPGRQWVPGYWHQVEGGVRWVPGVWMATQSGAGTSQYLGVPPTSLETGANSPPPTPDSIWAPGCWIWQEDQYFWRPGFWVTPQPNWVWIPSQYVWTPSGYLFAEGYWDRPIATRGQMFAPIYYSQPVYLQPNYIYQPTIGIVSSGLMVNLFVRPSCHAYYFGDYYATSNVSFGIYPWFSYSQTRYGYDPLFSFYSVSYRQSNPGWHAQMREEYLYRRDHIEARPFHTYAEMSRHSQTNVTVNNITVNNIRNVSFAQPINKIAASHNPAVAPMRFQKIEAAEQRQQIRQAQALQTFQQERAKRETMVAQNHTAGQPIRPKSIELPNSPIARATPAAARSNEAPIHTAAPHHTPPAEPVHPRAERPTAQVATQRAELRDGSAPADTPHPTAAKPAQAREAARSTPRREAPKGEHKR